MPKAKGPEAQPVELLDKTEALELLGIGVRTLERYVRQRRIRPAGFDRPVRGGKKKPLFDRRDLERLRAELAEPTPIPNEATTATLAPAAPGALAPAVGELLLLRDLFETRREAAGAVPLAERLTLTLDGAAELSGLSVSTLEAAIAAGQLRALRIGPRGARVVERAALVSFVAGLFSAKPARRRAR